MHLEASNSLRIQKLKTGEIHIQQFSFSCLIGGAMLDHVFLLHVATKWFIAMDLGSASQARRVVPNMKTVNLIIKPSTTFKLNVELCMGI